MLVLITGISGQIGKRMCELLTDQNVEVIGIDIVEFKNKKVKSLTVDMTDAKNIFKIKDFIKNTTHVIHLAGKVSDDNDIIKDLESQMNVSCLSTINLLKSLPDTVKHICFSSSMVVYGVPKKAKVTEETIINPVKSYAFGKIATENYLQYFSKVNNLPTAILRYSSVYGPNHISSRLIPSVIQNLLNCKRISITGEGKAVRDYIFVDDVCHITIKIMFKEYNGILNIGSGTGNDIKSICLKLLHITKKKKSLLVFNKEKKEGYSLYYDIGKLNSVLNSPYEFTNIEDGLLKTVKWHKKLIGENKNENFSK